MCAIGGKGQSDLKDEKNEFPIIKWPGIHHEIIFFTCGIICRGLVLDQHSARLLEEHFR